MALYSIPSDGSLESLLSREWLLTNGLGGFSSSTIVGCNTRRYHGLLCAATLPPVGRIMMLNRLGEILNLDHKESPTLEFSCNQFRQSVFPRGDQYLRRFEVDDVARFEYDIDGARIVKEVQLLWKRNVVGIRYSIDPGHHWHARLQLLPFVSMRDFHGLRRADHAHFRAYVGQRSISVDEGPWTLRLVADAGQFVDQPDWWYGHVYGVESERGQDDTEDLFTPGRLVFETETPATITLWASCDFIEPFDWDTELRRRRDALAAQVHVNQPDLTIQRLVCAANDFVVDRKSPDGSPGTSLIAGYPWFADWGRDTMISLPGLLLATGRFEQTRQVLSVYAKYVSEGMIPNRFDDYDSLPHYNTVDASLWFIHAAYEYLRLTQDRDGFESHLLPACRAIVQGYRRGTRFNIRMDESDGLMIQGDAHTQLTWMDAKTDGIAFTPRQGKAVEINALWYHALMLTGETELAERVAESFRKAYWISPYRGLADVVNGNDRDTSIRPNQIFAVSLPHSPLTEDQRHAVVETVRRELLTPMGLRSLACNSPGYQGRYTGSPRQRDSAYHNGTVWAWLIGPFLDAYLRVNHHSPESVHQARQWLQPLIDHLQQGCIGQIAEVFDGDPPHRPGGCFAQAWSVAEVLRLALVLKM